MDMEAVIKASITKEVKYTMQDLADVLCTAWEGGSSYWVGLATINHPTLPNITDYDAVKGEKTPTSEYAFDALLQGGSIHFLSYDEGGTEEGTITLESFRAGFIKFLATEDGEYSSIDPDGTVNAGNIDANKADYALQLALWGKSVFS